MAMRGVNFGGWLVLERWMTPSLFAGMDTQDQYEFMQHPDGPARMKRHIREFIREDDFAWLRDHSVHAIRIPVGYWILDGDDPYRPCIEALDWAVEMGEKYGIKVLICLHGAPGSQNGRDHSGRIGHARWYRTRAYRERTIEVLERLAVRYRDTPSVWGIELLNEPKFGILQCRLKRFSRRAYTRISRVARPGMYVIFHDAFTPRLMSNLLWPHRGNPVAMDIHWYHFAWPLHRLVPIAWYERFLIPLHHRLQARLAWWQPVIIGEWSAVLSGESLRRYPADRHEAMMDRHAMLQIAAFDNTLAWFYWSYRHEGPGIWNFRSMVDTGRIEL